MRVSDYRIATHARQTARLGKPRQNPYSDVRYRAIWETAYDDEMRQRVDAGLSTPPEPDDDYVHDPDDDNSGGEV